jgi:lactaldehyde reductase
MIVYPEGCFYSEVKKEDIPFLAQSAMDDACRPGNPKDPTLEDIIKLYESLM